MRAARLSTLVLALALSAPLCAQQRVSGLGQYQGYSAREYDSSVRSSLYITMRDGVRLAADIIRPARAGVVDAAGLLHAGGSAGRL